MLLLRNAGSLFPRVYTLDIGGSVIPSDDVKLRTADEKDCDRTLLGRMPQSNRAVQPARVCGKSLAITSDLGLARSK